MGLVLSGGGARGAYEAGVLHYIRTMLPHKIKKAKRFEILCGSSVGAINLAMLAAMSHDLTSQGKQAYRMWSTLKQEDVYSRDVLTFARFLTSGVFGIAKTLFYGKKIDEDPEYSKHFSGLLDTKPLAKFLEKKIAWQQISLNLKNNLLDAISVTTTNLHTGKLELFVERQPHVAYTGHYIFHDVKIEAPHILASAAIPLIFPAVQIENDYYIDGSVRMNTPLSPAIQLGADKVLVIGVQNIQERADREDAKSFVHLTTPPTMGTMIGRILSSIFNDRLDYDLEQLTRINRLIEWSEDCFGSDYIQRINSHLHDHKISGDIANRGLKKLQTMSIFPSQDLRDIFLGSVEKDATFKKQLTSFEISLLRALDVDLSTGKDFLSFLMFYPPYLKKLLELGFSDAQLQHNKLIDFLEDE